MLGESGRIHGGYKWWLAMGSMGLSVFHDIVSFGSCISLLMQLDDCSTSFKGVFTIGLVASIANVLITWLVWAPDSCQNESRIIHLFSRILLALVFALPVGVYAWALSKFDQHVAECPLSTPFQRWSILRSLLQTLVVLNTLKYLFYFIVEWTHPRQNSITVASASRPLAYQPPTINLKQTPVVDNNHF